MSHERMPDGTHTSDHRHLSSSSPLGLANRDDDDRAGARSPGARKYGPFLLLRLTGMERASSSRVDLLLRSVGWIPIPIPIPIWPSSMHPMGCPTPRQRHQTHAPGRPAVSRPCWASPSLGRRDARAPCRPCIALTRVRSSHAPPVGASYRPVRRAYGCFFIDTQGDRP